MTKMSKTVRFIATGLLVLAWLAGHAVAVEKEALLETLRSADAVYEKGITTSGRHHSVSPPWGRQTRENITDNGWSYTQSGQLKALFAVSRRVPQPDEAIFNRLVMLFDQKRSGKKTVSLMPEVSPLLYATSPNVRYGGVVQNLHAPDSTTLSLQIDLFLFAMGRGVIKNVDLLVETHEPIERNGERWVLITGSSKRYLSGEGTWKIYVLPDADYMVRSAQYFRSHDTDHAALEIETFGLNKKEGFFYPDKTEVRLPFGGGRGVLAHTLVLSDVELAFDPDLFDRVTREFDAELPRGSLIIDETSARVGPTTRIVGSGGR
jgi:hypothetical protein